MKQFLLKTKNLILISILFFAVGLLLIMAGFKMANNDIENLKNNQPYSWYQTITIEDNNRWHIGIHFGDYYFLNIFP